MEFISVPVRVRPRAPTWQGEMHSWGGLSTPIFVEKEYAMKKLIIFILVLLIGILIVTKSASEEIIDEIIENEQIEEVIEESPIEDEIPVEEEEEEEPIIEEEPVVEEEPTPEPVIEEEVTDVVEEVEEESTENIVKETPEDVVEDEVEESVEEEELIEEVLTEEEVKKQIDDGHYVELILKQHPQALGDIVIFEAILHNYAPGHIVDIIWEYSEDNEHWNEIEDEHELTYEFIVTRENMLYWYRVTVVYKYDVGDENDGAA